MRKPVINELVMICFALLAVGATSCDLAPAKPEEAFILYRDRMRNTQVTNARAMLSPESQALVQKMESNYQLDQPPENIAFLNALDPTTPPTPIKIEDALAVLEVRTLKGTNKIVRLIRSESENRWKVDVSDELRQLDNFLAARKTLDSMQEQAGEFAAAWKAMDSQLSRKTLIEPEKEHKDQVKEVKKTPVKKPAKAQKKGPSARED